jgi:hypothetical protein
MQRKSLLAVFLLTASLPLFSQTLESARESGPQQWTIGTGLSFFSPDYGPGTIAGGTLWLDNSLDRLPAFLSGVSLDFEARDLSLYRSSHEPVVRVDTAAGGAMYKWDHFSNVVPYGKFTAGMGNIDYTGSKGDNLHQGRAVTGMGGGCDIRAFRSIWVRADYEYEYWPNFWLTKANPATGAGLDPRGLTVGAIYHFGRDRRVY